MELLLWAALPEDTPAHQLRHKAGFSCLARGILKNSVRHGRYLFSPVDTGSEDQQMPYPRTGLCRTWENGPSGRELEAIR